MTAVSRINDQIRFFACALGIVSSGALPALAQRDMIGISWTGDVYTINSADGTGDTLGRSGFSEINALARAADDTIYATSGFAETTIISINVNTGVGTFISTTPVNSIRSAAFAPDGTMYVTDDVGAGMADSLWKVNPLSGDATLIGSTGRPGIQGMTVASDGTIYAWDVGANNDPGWGLVVLDPSTGMATDVNRQVGGGPEIQELCVDAADQIYGGRDALFKIDSTTGIETFVGTGVYSDLRGLDFLMGPSHFTISLNGTCPGLVKLIWNDALPNIYAAIVAGSGNGTTAIPPGSPCAGTTLGLSGDVFRVGLPFMTGPNGAGSVQGRVNAWGCNYYVQVVLGDCTVSNVAQVP